MPLSLPRPGGAPALRVLLAPHLDDAFDALADTLARDPLPPTVREPILVAQNNGLRTWLGHRLAHRWGCAAALDFRSPLALTTGLARALVPAARLADANAHPFDAPVMTWRLSRLLGALPDAPELDPLRVYLARSEEGTTALAARLARLFDDYQAYRPDVLARWKAGASALPEWPHEAWQAALWRLLHADAAADPDAEASTGSVMDRGESALALIQALEDRRPLSEAARQSLPPRLSVFGARVFPPVYYGVLAALARHLPVTLYAVAPGLPSAPYGETFEAEGFAHPLLRATSGHVRAYVSVLREIGAAEPERIGPPPVLPPAASALARLQTALRADAPPGAPKPLAPEDRSIRVLDCHAPLREMETLRDALLDAFDTLPGLRPSDVLVLLPDLETYAPLVDAVFGAEETDGLRLPYHVVEHPHAPALRVMAAFSAALRLPDGRVTVTDLLDLLDHPAVARRAGIREDELPRLGSWMGEAGVRWGRSRTEKAALGLPDDDLHTWRYGLDRLLLGYAIGDGGPALGTLPCDAAGLDGADLLGRFAEWAHALFERLDALDRSRPLAHWPEHLLFFVDALLDARSEEETEAVVFLRTCVGDLADLGALFSQSGEAVSLRAVRAHLETAFRTFDRHEPYLTGRITFARPFPLHHAPHRVVAFAGLTATAFPAPDDAPSFCMIAHAPRAGDASPRQAEKQLFLDAVMSAGDRLILSYPGRSQKDGSTRAPSVVLDAFLDACDVHFGDGAREQIVERHRLQPFSPAYFSAPTATGSTPGGHEGDGSTVMPPALFSYAAQHGVQPDARAGAPFVDLVPGVAAPPERLVLGDLASAWANPSRFWATRHLRLRLTTEDTLLPPDEPVVLDNLEAFLVRKDVLEGVLDGLSEAEIEARLRLGGRLPGGAPGLALVRRLLAEVRPLAERVQAFGRTEPRALRFRVGETALEGVVERVGEGGALRVRPGSVRPPDLVYAWIDHLALHAEGSEGGRPASPGPTRYEGLQGGCVFRPVPSAEARLFLHALVRGYACLAEAPAPLFAHASHAYTKERGDISELAGAVLARTRALEAGERPPPFGLPLCARSLGKARRAFEGGWGASGDRDDPYVSLCVRGHDPFASAEAPLAGAFARWSAMLWAPLLRYHAPAS